MGRCMRKGATLISTYLVVLVHNTTQMLTTRTHTHLYEHVYANPTYEHLQRIGPADLEISEVTIDASLSTGTSLTT